MEEKEDWLQLEYDKRRRARVNYMIIKEMWIIARGRGAITEFYKIMDIEHNMYARLIKEYTHDDIAIECGKEIDIREYNKKSSDTFKTKSDKGFPKNLQKKATSLSVNTDTDIKYFTGEKMFQVNGLTMKDWSEYFDALDLYERYQKKTALDSDEKQDYDLAKRKIESFKGKIITGIQRIRNRKDKLIAFTEQDKQLYRIYFWLESGGSKKYLELTLNEQIHSVIDILKNTSMPQIQDLSEDELGVLENTLKDTLEKIKTVNSARQHDCKIVNNE